MNELISTDSGFLLNLAIRLAINSLALILLIKVMKVRSNHKSDFYFSYIAIGLTVFFICYLLENVKLELGFALGLFAIFAILRYRTYQIPIKEMTYLFVIIGISVINALTSDPVSELELIIVNVVVVVGLFLLEHFFSHKTLYSLTVKYPTLDNIHKSKEKELLADLESRTGIKLSRFEISKVDFKAQYAIITVYFDDDGSTSQLGQEIKE